LKYEPINPISHAEADQAAAATPDTLSRAVLAIALHDEDATWAAAFCEQFVLHSDPRVRGAALLGFGHLARRFRRLDAARIQPLLELGLADADPWVRGQSRAAAEDAEFFLGWHFRG
jgi:hypothetical protein